MEEDTKGRESSKVAQLALFDGELEAFEKGKDELNLAEFPIALVADSAKAGQLTLTFSDTIRDSSTQQEVERSVTVHGTEEWGLPAAQDDEVMIGLLQLCYLTGWPKHFRFTRYQLCKLLRWSIGGASYRRIYMALHRLSTTSYNYRYSWRDKTNQEWIPSQVFSYIQALKVHEADRPTNSGLCEVTWSDAFHKSLEAGNLKGIDFGFFVSLKGSITKRLYRFLDKRFGAGRPVVSYDLKNLAFEKIGVARSYKDAAQIKRLLIPAITELERLQYLAPASKEERFEKLARGRWRVHFRRCHGEQRKQPAKRQQSIPSDLERRLIAKGVFHTAAKKLVAEYPEPYLEQKLDEFAFRKADTNPGGLLAVSIRKDLPPPAGYKNPQERAEDAAQRKIRDERQARQDSEKKLKEEATQAAEERARLVAEKHLASFSKEERLALEAEAKRLLPKAPPKTIYWTMVGLVRERGGGEPSQKM